MMINKKELILCVLASLATSSAQSFAIDHASNLEMHEQSTAHARKTASDSDEGIVSDDYESLSNYCESELYTAIENKSGNAAPFGLDEQTKIDIVSGYQPLSTSRDSELYTAIENKSGNAAPFGLDEQTKINMSEDAGYLTPVSKVSENNTLPKSSSSPALNGVTYEIYDEIEEKAPTAPAEYEEIKKPKSFFQRCKSKIALLAPTAALVGVSGYFFYMRFFNIVDEAGGSSPYADTNGFWTSGFAGNHTSSPSTSFPESTFAGNHTSYLSTSFLESTFAGNQTTSLTESFQTTPGGAQTTTSFEECLFQYFFKEFGKTAEDLKIFAQDTLRQIASRCPPNVNRDRKCRFGLRILNQALDYGSPEYEDALAESLKYWGTYDPCPRLAQQL